MPVFSNSSNNIWNNDSSGQIEGTPEPTPPIGKNYFIRYRGGANHVIAKVVSTGSVGFCYILKIQGFIRNDGDMVSSKYDGSYLISDGSIERNGFYTGNGLILSSSGSILSITLAEPATYGLTVETRPFVGEDEDVTINFDRTDETKYIKILP